MLPAAHLVPCEILEDLTADGVTELLLQCHQELLPLPESGPGYTVFQPVGDLPATAEDIDWPTLLTTGICREEWWLPRSSLLRSLTDEGQLAAFRMGDPFDLAPQQHQVEWTDDELVVLRLQSPLRVAEVLGPEPPPWPCFAMTPVLYELTGKEGPRDFAAGGVPCGPDHWQYRCWALKEFPASQEDQPPRLPHQSPDEEPFDAVETWLVCDDDAVQSARATGWRYTGRLWLNPLSGALQDGAIFGVLVPDDDLISVTGWHFLHLGHALTSLVPFFLTFDDGESVAQRWSNNLPFPQLPAEG